MVFVYAALVIVTAIIGFVVRRRAQKAEKRFHEENLEYQDHIHRMEHTPARSTDEHVSRLALSVDARQDRDAAADKHDKWKARRNTVDAVRDRLKSWRGRKAPYVVGVLDTLGVIGALDHFGLHGAIYDSVVAFAKAFFTQVG